MGLAVGMLLKFQKVTPPLGEVDLFNRSVTSVSLGVYNTGDSIENKSTTSVVITY